MTERQVMQKQVRLFLIKKKKEEEKNFKGSKRNQNKAKWWWEKGRSGEKSRIVRDRLKMQHGNYLREDRLKWTKRDYEQPGESARGTYLDVWCHSWVRASLSSLKWEETMDSSPPATRHTCWECSHHRRHRHHVIVHCDHEPQKLPIDNRLQPGLKTRIHPTTALKVSKFNNQSLPLSKWKYMKLTASVFLNFKL